MTWTVIWRNAADSSDRRAWSMSNRARATSVPRHMRLSVAISGVESLSIPIDASPTSLTVRLSIRVTNVGAESVATSLSVDAPSSSVSSDVSDGRADSSVTWGSSAMAVAVASSLTPSLAEALSAALSAASKASIMAVKLSSIMMSVGDVTVSTLGEALPLSASSTTTKLTFSSLVERMVRSTGVSVSCAKTKEGEPHKQAVPTSR